MNKERAKAFLYDVVKLCKKHDVEVSGLFAVHIGGEESNESLWDVQSISARGAQWEPEKNEESYDERKSDRVRLDSSLRSTK